MTPIGGREDDQRAHGAEPRAVGPEEREDPPEVRLADRRVGGPLGRIVGVEAASWHEGSVRTGDGLTATSTWRAACATSG